MPQLDLLVIVIAGSLICPAVWEWLKSKVAR
jgi:hypothetical protein